MKDCFAQARVSAPAFLAVCLWLLTSACRAGATVLPDPATSSADLAHPIFTARGAIVAELVHPTAGEVAANASVTVEVRTSVGAGVELVVNGSPIAFSRIGQRTIDAATGATRYSYYGVGLRPGPNDVALTALGADGMRGTTTHATVFGSGPPAHAKLTLAGSLRADGTSRALLTFLASDAWGHPASAGSNVRFRVVHGDVSLDSFASSTTTGELAVGAATLDIPIGADGTAVVRLRSGLLPGELEVRATCAGVEAAGQYFVSANIRRPFVDGLVTAGLGNVPGDPAAADGIADGVNARRGRAALYASGAVDATTLATVAYDTAHRLQQDSTTGSFIDDPDERPYATYGDASVRRDDALSRDHLYARIDRGRNSFTWGEFNASTAPSTDMLGGYRALVDGARVELANTTQQLRVFRARNDVAFDRRVFAPSGLSTLAQTLFPNIVIGSDTVTLVALDRRTGAVLAQNILARNSDYVLDAASGQFRFIDIPLPFDDAGNPQQVVVTYEYTGTGAQSATLGGRMQTTLRNQIVLGAGYVNDTTGAGNTTLASQDLSGPLANGNWTVSHVTSHGGVGFGTQVAAAAAHGDALQAAFTTVAGNNSFSAGINDTAAGFSNPFGGLATPGLFDARASFTRRLANSSELAVTIDRQSNFGNGNTDSQSEASLRLRRFVSKAFEFTLGVTQQSYRSATPATGPAGGDSALQPSAATLSATGSVHYAAGKLGIDVSHAQSVAGTPLASQPAQSALQIGYRATARARAYVRMHWSSLPVQSFAASTAGLTAATATTRSAEFGIERTLSPTLSTDAEYLVARTGSGTDISAAIGVRERLSLSNRLKGDAYFQRANDAGTSISHGFTAYGASLNFAGAGGDFHSTAALQARTGAVSSGTTFSLAATGALARDFSLLFALFGTRESGSFENSARLGLAWRPDRSDRGVTLVQFAKSSGTTTLVATRSGVLSLEQFYRLTTRFTVSGRYAYKIDGDSLYAARTSLLGLRIAQRVGTRVDIGGEARTTFVRDIAGATGIGDCAEIGFRLGDRSRLAAGYNFKRLADPSLALGPARSGLYVTVTSVFDALLGWGRER